MVFRLGFAAALAGAAVVLSIVAALGGLGGLARPAATDALLADLDASVARETSRVVEARLTGLPRYAAAPFAPPPAASRGSERSIALWKAAAAIERYAREHDTAASKAALGVARLLIDDLAGGIEALETAVERQPQNARFLADLSAAYLSRAQQSASAEDLTSALAAASRSLRLDAQGLEASFNRALALDRLHLTSAASEAWGALLARQASHSWTDDITRRLTALSARSRPSGARPPPSGTEPSDAAAGGAASSVAPSAVASHGDHQTVREHIEDALLPAWGRAVIAGESVRAREILREAAGLAAKLAAEGADRMPLDETARIERFEALGPRGRARLNALARGHDVFGQARDAYLKEQQQRAAELLTGAAPHFAAARSPYEHWALVLTAAFQRNRGDTNAALTTLGRLRITDLPHEYYHLRGRAAWAYGVVLYARGRFDLGRMYLTEAVASYQAAGEGDNLAATRTILAEAYWVLGDHAKAWEMLHDVLQALEARGESKRDYHFWLAAALADGAGLHDAALEFEDAHLRHISSARSRAEAYVRRARTRLLLDQRDGALADLDQAERQARTIDDPALSDRNVADVRMARAEALAASNPRAALAQSDAAITYIHRANPAQRLGPALVTRAKAREALGDAAGARGDLEQAIASFEQKRSALLSPVDRVQSFNAERAAYKQLIRLETVVRGDPAAGLRLAERARGGIVPPPPLTLAASGSASLPATRIDPTVAHASLAPDVALIYYVTLDDGLLMWVVTREQWRFVKLPIASEALSRRIGELTRLIQDGAGFARVAALARALHDDLVSPALQAGGGKATLFFVPDGPLHGLAFSVLSDASGQPLIATRTIGIAASMASFQAASDRLAGFTADDVLAIGDGHDPHTSGLVRLPMADAEAAAIGRLYPRSEVLAGAAATRQRVLAADRAVLHFAGHTVVNRGFPLFSQLLLAADSRQNDAGHLLASDIVAHDFGRTRVAVLATCEAAAGRESIGDGMVSVVSAFLATGVPAVIASSMVVDDSAAQRIFTTFHRELRQRGDAATALRAAQLAVWRDGGNDLPVRTWGTFLAFGGARRDDRASMRENR